MKTNRVNASLIPLALTQFLFIIILFFIYSTPSPCADKQGADKQGADKQVFDTTPKLNNTKKWRIAYYEGGDFIDYQQVLTQTTNGLMKLDWIEDSNIPPQKGEQTKELWNWLSHSAKSKYIEFVDNAYYSANWDEDTRKKLVSDLLKRLNEKKDIDLVIAMGTWAGKDLATNKHSVSTMVMSASDPVAAGIIKSAEDSGYDHVHAQIDPNLYARQLRIFHEIIGFKKLGIAYENSIAGKSYAQIDVADKIGKERGFTISHCYTQSDIADSDLAAQTVIKCFNELVKNCDAIYVTQQGGVNSKSIPELVKIANDNRIPTFSQSGSDEVKYGFLLSISHSGYKYLGEFNANVLAKILNGAKPNQLNQIFEDPPKIAINLKTAEIVGFDPPVVILGAADEIYKEIVTPSN